MFWKTDTEPGPDAFKEWGYDYIYVGKETCPTTGKPHYQGYVRFANPRSIGGMQKLNRGAWFACKGTELQNIKYCSKEGDLVLQDGEPEKKEARQGRRNDIHDVREMVKAGAGMTEIVMSIDSYQAIKVAETMLKYIEPKRNWQPEVFWIYGPTGTGKSRFAFEACTDPWVSGETSKWFEGYDKHEDVIFDDFRKDFCSFSTLLRLTDRYPYRIECKGSSRQFLAKRIFITCCFAPHNAFSVKDEDLQQLGRRITEIIYISAEGVTLSAPGSTIGIEPSVERIVPELGTEQKSGVI